MDPVNPASLPPEYWSSLDPYANPDSSHHHSHPPQPPTPQQTQQQPPLGIGWDHPVLHPHASHRDQAGGPTLYQSPTPQPWQQNPLHHQTLAPSTLQDLGMPAQYRQVPQYAQGQVAFDPHTVPAADNHSQYQPFSFSSNFYTPQHIPLSDPFPQSHSPRPARQQSGSTPYQPLHQTSVPQYGISPGFHDDPTTVGRRGITMAI